MGHIDSSGGNHNISSVISLLLLLYSDISSVVTMMSLVWSSILLSSLLAGCDAISCTSKLQSLSCLPVFSHSPTSLQKCYCTSTCPDIESLGQGGQLSGQGGQLVGQGGQLGGALGLTFGQGVREVVKNVPETVKDSVRELLSGRK